MSDEIVWDSRGSWSTATAFGFRLMATYQGVDKEIRITRLSDKVTKRCVLRGVVGSPPSLAEGMLREWMSRIKDEETTRECVVECIQGNLAHLSEALFTWGQALQDEREPLRSGPTLPLS